MFGLETKSSLRLDFRAKAGLIYKSLVIYPKEENNGILPE